MQNPETLTLDNNWSVLWGKPQAILAASLLVIASLWWAGSYFTNEAPGFAEQSIAIPAEALDAQKPVIPANKAQWSSVPVLHGDNLSRLFKKLSLPQALVSQILHSDKRAKILKKLYPGQTLYIYTNKHGAFEQLVYPYSPTKTLTVTLQAGHMVAETSTMPTQVHVRKATGTIHHSLARDGKKAGLNSALIAQLTKVFSWQIDFAKELRRGDKFEVLYAQNTAGERKVGSGYIVAAQIHNRGKTLSAFRYMDSKGRTDYYTADGQAVRKAFLRKPVTGGYISSPFNLHRKHPVLHYTRPHYGVDFAAVSGTPIHAAGDGRIAFIGHKGGYGKLIKIRHNSMYSTYYGHMKGFARHLRRGQRVHQGQIIGYVGHTGLATGSHLHYEFRVHNRPVNPLKVRLPQARRLPKSQMATFKKAIKPLQNKLNHVA